MTTCSLASYEMVSSQGLSPEADFVVKESKRLHDEWQRNAYLFSQISRVWNELTEVLGETSEPDWDGYSARAVTNNTYQVARKVLAVLPLGMQMPSVGAEPDGHITLEWYHSPHKTLSISVSPEGDLHYAALLGASVQYGTELFYGTVPDVILDLVSKVVAV